ncbi:MAG: efflux RND transporter periplasmic adaptor subunit [Rhodocyclaceae bacterium]|nr:efflux RND transporter periplasmic adaptor subunit [Rhodocyclaceae bacterium]
MCNQQVKRCVHTVAMKRRGIFITLSIVLLIIGGVLATLYLLPHNTRPAWKFAKVDRGALTAHISATGTLNPVVSVQVGSQVSGQIKEVLVDFNSEVTAGQLMARLDPENFQHRMHQAKADLEAAQASVAVNQANLNEAHRDFERKNHLVEKRFLSPAERDKAQSTREASEAQLKSSQAQSRQREAQLAQVRVELNRTAIRAPITGIVIKRSIEPGQTVAASLQSPELFVIAKNLADMQVETAIDEADVGRVRLDQKATFTVDAFPGRSFEGTVRQIRKAAQVVSNVVTYTVVISAANPELILMPGMTANVRIVTAQKDQVLKVPNAALRFKLPTDKKAQSELKERGNSRVFILDTEGNPKAVSLKTGLTDGAMTEILDGNITEGTEVLLGTMTPVTSKKPTNAPHGSRF